MMQAEHEHHVPTTELQSVLHQTEAYISYLVGPPALPGDTDVGSQLLQILIHPGCALSMPLHFKKSPCVILMHRHG